MQRYRFFRYHRRMLQQVERLYQLVAWKGVLPAETVWIRSLLNFIASERSRYNPATGNHLALMNPRTNTRCKPGINFAELHVRFGERHALDTPHLRIRGQQQS